tara:strand:- start:16192 stop:16572 length:381 start_codon:yes stop_codon:yes gene_type:complete
MKLHDQEITTQGADVTELRIAVPGGWIYRAFGPAGADEIAIVQSFVPDPTCEHWQTQNRIPLKDGWRWDPSEEERHVWILVDPDDAVAGEARPSGQWLHDGHYHTGGFSLMPAMWALARHLDAVAE